MTTMMRFAFAPERIDAIRGLLSDLPATRALRNAFYTAEGITDPVRHGDPIQLQIAIDGVTLNPDALGHELEGASVCLRVIYDAKRFRRTVHWPVPDDGLGDDELRLIDVVPAGPEHLHITVDGVLHAELIGHTAGEVPQLSAPNVFCIDATQRHLAGAHPGEVESLTVLSMEAFQIDAFADWTTLTALQLFPGSDQTKYEGLDGLARLQCLRVLVVAAPGPTFSIDAVSSLHTLEHLEIAGLASLTDLTPLSGLRALRRLTVAKCPRLASLAGIESLTLLEELDARSCDALVNVASLADKPKLRVLNLQSCKQIGDLSSLHDLPELRELNLMSTAAVVNLDGLKASRKLERLNLRHCKSVTDIAAVAAMPELAILMLEGCSNVADFSPIQHLTGLRQVSLRRCKAFAELDVLAGNPDLEDLNVSECTYIRDWSTLDGLPSLQRLKGVPPEIAVRVLATHAVDHDRIYLAASRMGLFERSAESKEEKWLEVAARQPESHSLLGALGRALGMVYRWESFDKLEAAGHAAMATLLQLAAAHHADGVAPLIATACGEAQHESVQQAIAALCTQSKPLPAPTLVALAEHLGLAPADWARPLEQNLRNVTLAALAAVDPDCATPEIVATALALRSVLDGRRGPRLPDGFPVDTRVHGDALTAIEDRVFGDLESLLFCSVASDYATVIDAAWRMEFHRRLTDRALREPDSDRRSTLLSAIAAGLSETADPAWAAAELDGLLRDAARIDPDTSTLQAAVARAHAGAGRWNEATDSVFQVARLKVRDACLHDLAGRVLQTGRADRAQRALELLAGLSDRLERRDALVTLGQGDALLASPVAYGQLVALLADQPRAQQRVIESAVSAHPSLANAQVPDDLGPVTERERRVASAAKEDVLRMVRAMAPDVAAKLK